MCKHEQLTRAEFSLGEVLSLQGVLVGALLTLGTNQPPHPPRSSAIPTVLVFM